MSTTTIRIDDTLKERVAAAAARAGKTAHAFIVEALAETVERQEAESAFQRLADARWERLQETGKTVGWEQARLYLQARAAGQRPRKPAARRTVR